ncbi:hypothetical protein HJC23_000202 [Cyclotella cryptica]|uniref:Uncharacterized protein n=1 Tax=Cyclotella cryptica TaxID=29204 RepID=A0ABD3QD82_9STRA|eukprot:CCRYP_006386-RA/>CCRYP_006386-RA protein AED:0.33 eAED:0.33 QI:0/-1/0/1/-1/1/1/0/207
MYGGSHYIRSAAADMTAQGRAILNAAIRFGDGRTLPFPPCKRYYNPYGVDKKGNRVKMYACRLHHELRKKRVTKEGGRWKEGEKRLDDFWCEENTQKSDGADGEAASGSKKIKESDDNYPPDCTLISSVETKKSSENMDMNQPCKSDELTQSDFKLSSVFANKNSLPDEEEINQSHDNFTSHTPLKSEQRKQGPNQPDCTPSSNVAK